MTEHEEQQRAVAEHSLETKLHPEMGYEPTDVTIRGSVMLLSGIFGGLLLTLLIVFIGQRWVTAHYDLGPKNSDVAPGRVIPTGPLLEVHPWDTLPQLRAEETKRLTGYGKDAQGKIHIPIDRAMDLTVKELPIRPGSPNGLTTPGGEGRQFSHSLKDIPPQYRQRPQIQGEIEKNAQ